MAPKVTFIVPCYNLAHLLPDCINSILSQSYPDFEILIMDDCSPDNTAEVAHSFSDSRVAHIRNETNLRHLANYNKGIELARGEYIWLISADDRLRKPYVLERYVQVMDGRPECGFVFCPAMALQDNVETGTVEWSFHGTEDAVFKGHDFLMRILQSNCVTAPCGMARKKCYQIELFPLDMPYAGDWYLWSLFALHHDVAYLGEPMVNYRLHDLNFTNFFMAEGIKDNIADEINVRWRIKERAESKGCALVARRCRDFIADDYACRLWKKAKNNSQHGLVEEEFENSLVKHAKNCKEEKKIRASVYCELADRYYQDCQYDKAVVYYQKTILANPINLTARVKFLLVAMGSTGTGLRNTLSAAKRVFGSQISRNNEMSIKS